MVGTASRSGEGGEAATRLRGLVVSQGGHAPRSRLLGCYTGRVVGPDERTAKSAAVVDGYYPIVDGGISALLRAFPFESVRPSLLYYRHPAGRKETAALRGLLLAQGYQTSAHWETGAWGEHNLAWRTDRCAAPGMPGRPLWWSE